VFLLFQENYFDSLNCFFASEFIVMKCPMSSDVLFAVLHAREQGSNKKNASQSCALSMVRQLFHLGVIEVYTGVTKKKPSDEVQCSIVISQRNGLM